MNVKTISAISWDDVIKRFPPNNINMEFCYLVGKISEQLKPINKDYVYHTQFEFGEKLINSGKLLLEQFIVKFDSDLKISTANLHEDLNYSDDPLGMILKNHVEVYSENILTDNDGRILDCYTVPLNIIKEGELFGVFGTLDYLLPHYNRHLVKNLSSIDHDWYVVAGNISYEIVFPFENDTDCAYIPTKCKMDFRKRYNQLSYVGQNKIDFIRDNIYSSDQSRIENNNRWMVEVIYFPKHYFEIPDDNLRNTFENSLYKIGWVQSSPLRYALFENKIIADVLYQSNISFKHNKHFLNTLYDYISKAGMGKQFVLTPLINPNHVLNIALFNFKKRIDGYLKKAKHYEPVICTYDRLHGNNWGALSIPRLPFLLNYDIETLNLNTLYEELTNIRDEISEKSQNHRFPEIILVSDLGKGEERINGRNHVKELLSEAFSIDSKHICLSSKEFKNLILINSC